ncbi:MAG: hypothetical protein JW789_03900 [Candidatus Aenigmarchaeota archaeon]|nr:hypothetical protein [Candidatus Aenigmarchaeota archaeon]
MLSLEELIEEISGKSGKTVDEIRVLIKDKQTELSDLVSEEGAAYIVGRELGVELVRENGNRELKIANVVPDMRNVDIVARISAVFEEKGFERNGKTGTVQSMILADETGTIRLPLWNDEVKLISSIGLRKNNLIKVTGAWSKKDNYKDGTELRLSKRSKIEIVEAGEAPAENEQPHTEGNPGSSRYPQVPSERVLIKDVQEGMNVMIKGCLMQVYKKKPFFEVCSKCGARIKEVENGYICNEHGNVTPLYTLLITGVFDDGSGNIRAVMFRDQAEKLFGMKPEEVKEKYASDGDEFWTAFSNLGKEYMIEGRAKMNDFSKEIEIVANNVSEVNVKEECQRILASLS